MAHLVCIHRWLMGTWLAFNFQLLVTVLLLPFMHKDLFETIFNSWGVYP